MVKRLLKDVKEVPAAVSMSIKEGRSFSVFRNENVSILFTVEEDISDVKGRMDNTKIKRVREHENAMQVLSN